MNRRDFVLAALAVSKGEEHTPVQVQKLFFLLEEKLASRIGSPHFKFVPFDYGPFDHNVYQQLEELESEGLVKINQNPRTGFKTFSVNSTGIIAGNIILDELDPSIVEYMQRLSGWVRSRSFAELVSSVYEHFPKMKVNSVFQH